MCGLMILGDGRALVGEAVVYPEVCDKCVFEFHGGALRRERFGEGGKRLKRLDELVVHVCRAPDTPEFRYDGPHALLDRLAHAGGRDHGESALKQAFRDVLLL